MRYLLLIFITIIIVSCNQPKLPYFGRSEYNPETKDSLQHTVEEFIFINQNQNIVGLDYLKGKITVVNFFFTSCPSICPIMIDELIRLQEEVKGKYDIQILSHTVDPQRDSVGRLNEFIKQKKIDTKNWDFVTGEKQDLYESGVFNYYLSTQEDAFAEGGFLHSEKFVLIDKDLHIRGFYNGTEKEDVNNLINDLEILFNEYR
jgi:protein SCO1/2